MILALTWMSLAAASDAGTTRFAPADRTPLPALPVLTGSRPGDTLDTAELGGQIVVINAWYEY
jgi:hypothetical protein